MIYLVPSRNVLLEDAAWQELCGEMWKFYVTHILRSLHYKDKISSGKGIHIKTGFSFDGKRKRKTQTNPRILLHFASHPSHNHHHHLSEPNQLALSCFTSLRMKRELWIFLSPNCIFAVGRKEPQRILAFFTNPPLLFLCSDVGNSLIPSASSVVGVAGKSWQETQTREYMLLLIGSSATWKHIALTTGGRWDSASHRLGLL